MCISAGSRIYWRFYDTNITKKQQQIMQQTGNKALYLRLTSDGYCFDGVFSACPAERMAGTLKGRFADAGHEAAYVEIDTLSTVAVPDSYYDNALAEGYLTVNNLLLPEYVPVQAQWNGIAIVMSCREDVAAWLRERYGANAHFLSPLTHALGVTDKIEVLSLYLTGENVHIALWDKELKFAQVLPYSSRADLDYYISTLTAEYGLANVKIYISGEYNKKLIKELKRLFPIIFDADNKRKA
jgi:hypothetical protein